MSAKNRQGVFELADDIPLTLADDPDIDLKDLLTVRQVERDMSVNAYPHDAPPTGPVACVICFAPTTNHRSLWNHDWSGLWHSMCRDESACYARATS